MYPTLEKLVPSECKVCQIFQTEGLECGGCSVYPLRIKASKAVKEETTRLLRERPWKGSSGIV